MHWIDPDCLPETKGNVERFLVNPDGEIDGVILIGAIEAALVHVPPHLSAEIEAGIQIGDAVRVRGVRLRGTSMIVAIALIAADGRTIIDQGPAGKQDEKRRKQDHRPARPKQVEVVGKTEMSLYSPKGELRGALLEDGSIVRIRPNEARRFAEFLRPRASLAVRGEGIETPYGRVVKAREIGTDLNSLMPTTGEKSK
jgi:hypothetical protein